MSEPNPRAGGAAVCDARLAFFLGAGVRRLLQNPERILSPFLAAGDVAMDVGCGPGFFTSAMARLVGPAGKVVAVDIQQKMLDLMKRRLESEGLADRVEPHLSDGNRLGVAEQVDFALAFYVVHEVPDVDVFLREVHAVLKPAGRLLIVEPKMHVAKARFDATLQACAAAGFRCVGEPRIFFSRTTLLERS